MNPTVPSTGRISRVVADLAPSAIRRFFDLVAQTEGVISLGVGEPDFATPWSFSSAAIGSLEAGRTTYTSNQGLLSLRRGIVAHIQRLYDLLYDPTDEALVTIGVSEGLDIACRAILNPGDEVVIVEPCFVSYQAAVRLAHAVPVPVATNAADAFNPREADVAAAITPRTRAIMVCSPSNPTGAVYSRACLEGIARLAAKHDLLVLSDEIYDQLYYGTEGHTCFAALPGMRERTIYFNGFSKAYAMTGWRIGYACGPADIIGAMTKIHQYAVMCAPTASQEAALEALRRGEPRVAEMVRSYDQRRRLLVDGFNRLGLDCFEPLGAFYTFPSVASTGLSDEEFCERLLVEQKVATVPGSAFGACGAGHIRATYATGLPQLREALERIERFLQSL